MDAPTIVQSSVLLAIGAQPSMPRLKQLAKTITSNSQSRNLGLDNTIFGKVKQVRLSTILQHSLNVGDGGGAPSSSPAPMPSPNRHNDHNRLVPTMPPTPSARGGKSPAWRNILPAPQPSSSRAREKHPHSPTPSIAYEVKPPGCRLRQKRSAGSAPEWFHPTPIPSPAFVPQNSVAPSPA